MIRLVPPVAAIAAAGVAAAQAPPAGQTPPPQPGQTQQLRFEELPPAMRLGLRADSVRRSAAVIRTVVLVSDPASYVEAVARWSIKGRYPVLFDDGSALMREDIARFVRAFKPDRVVRFSAADEARLRAERGDNAPAPLWPADAAGRQAMMDGALFRAWGTASAQEFVAKLAELQLPPPGVVVANPSDPAWPAALALAAGRAQPFLWGALSGSVNGTLASDEAERFCASLETSCQNMGLPWRDLGDAVDAVTLCLNAPARVQMGVDKIVALTDLIGRRLPDGAPDRENGVRWAWAGQVFGSEAQSSYRAMCPLFLPSVPSTRAWLFDGYSDTTPWNAFDMTKAGEMIRQGGGSGPTGIETLVDDAFDGVGRSHWLRRVARPIDAGLILVNTKGMSESFDLDPGICRSGDVPSLVTPAVVHFVHSWSAEAPAERATIAGRWLERGAYAYAGSVHEPFLQAFVPQPAFAARMVSYFPLGAAARLDGPAWRIAVLGDPLLTFGPAPPTSDLTLPLEGVHDVAEDVPAALKEDRFADALDLLTLLGRDGDAVRLATALRSADPKAFTPEVARAAIPALFREGELEDLVAASQQAAGLAGDLEPPLRDFIWLAGSARAEAASSQPDEKLIGALRAAIRPDQAGADAATIAPAMTILYGREPALGMLRSIREKTSHPTDTAALDAAIARLSGR